MMHVPANHRFYNPPRADTPLGMQYDCQFDQNDSSIGLRLKILILNFEGYLWYPAISTCVNRFLNFCNDTQT